MNGRTLDGTTTAPGGDDEAIIGNANPDVQRSASAATRLGQVRRELAVARRGRARRVQQHGARLRDEGERAAGAATSCSPRSTTRTRIARAGDLLVALDRGRLVRPPAERDGRLHVRPARARCGGGPTRASTCRATTCSCSPPTRATTPRCSCDAGLASRGIDYLDLPARPDVHGRRPHSVLTAAAARRRRPAHRSTLRHQPISTRAYAEFLRNPSGDGSGALLLAPAALGAVQGCTDLTETPHDALTPENAFTERRRGARRRRLGVRRSCAARCGATTTSARSRPTRSSSRRAAATGSTTAAGSRSTARRGRRTARSALDDMNGTWNDLFSGVARANLMIERRSRRARRRRQGRRSWPSCARCARGTTTCCMDMFGGVPIVTDDRGRAARRAPRATEVVPVHRDGAERRPRRCCPTRGRRPVRPRHARAPRTRSSRACT